RLTLHGTPRADRESAVGQKRDAIEIVEADVVGTDRLRPVVDREDPACGTDRDHRVARTNGGDERTERAVDELPTLTVEPTDASAVRHDVDRLVRRAARRERLLEDERAGVRGDLAQRRREARRVACEERTRGVGEELALARDRKLNERGDDRGEQREGDRDHGDDRVAATVALAAPAARPEERPPHPV